jgi:gliding motility-associated-like protein
VSIRVLPNDFNLFNNDSSICKGSSVQINALGDTAFNYSWSPTLNVSDPTIINPLITPDTSETYTITATYPGCNDIVKDLFIDVQPVPYVYIGADREKCQYDTIQIAASVTPSTYPSYTYSWTPVGAVNNPTVKDVVVISQINASPLTLTVTTPAGCTGSDNINVVVHPGNFGTLTPSDTAICPRDSIYFQAGGGISYAWSPYISITDTTIFNPIASPGSGTLYSVVVTDTFACTDTLSAYISVHPDAVVSLGPDISIYPGDSVQLSTSGNALYFNWPVAGGLSSSTSSSPYAFPTSSTRYFVIGTTENGCSTIDSIDITVDAASYLLLPNAFSPGSEPNSQLLIQKKGIANLKSFTIFNRWGTKVFETADLNKGWDGRLNDEPQPMGVYIYTIDAVSDDGRPIVKQGNVTLIR